MLIGATPPAALADWRYLLVPVGAGLLAFGFHPALGRVERMINVLDACGLALFCVAGAIKAIGFGLGRWFGPADAVQLHEIRQTGATGIVTALHDIPYGVVWPQEAIAERKATIEAAGLRWSVVESLPVSEAIKLGDGDLEPLFANYRESLRNLAAQGVDCVCYNFMPVLDWTRTQLAVPLPGGVSMGGVLRF